MRNYEPDSLPTDRAAGNANPRNRRRHVLSRKAKDRRLALLSQEAADVVKRLFSSPQVGNVGGKDVDHALPRLHLDRSAGSLQALPISNRVVEENFIFTYMNSDGRKPGQIGVQR